MTTTQLKNAYPDKLRDMTNVNPIPNEWNKDPIVGSIKIDDPIGTPLTPIQPIPKQQDNLDKNMETENKPEWIKTDEYRDICYLYDIGWVDQSAVFEGVDLGDNISFYTPVWLSGYPELNKRGLCLTYNTITEDLDNIGQPAKFILEGTTIEVDPISVFKVTMDKYSNDKPDIISLPYHRDIVIKMFKEDTKYLEEQATLNVRRALILEFLTGSKYGTTYPTEYEVTIRLHDTEDEFVYESLDVYELADYILEDYYQYKNKIKYIEIKYADSTLAVINRRTYLDNVLPAINLLKHGTVKRVYKYVKKQ